MNLFSINNLASASEPESMSNGLKLKELTVSAGSISFDPDTTEYSIKVPADTERILVNASVQEEGSFYTVSGNDNLKEGYNDIVITVTDSSGNIGTYTIRAQVGEVETSEEETENTTVAAATKSAAQSESSIQSETEASLVQKMTSGNYRYVTYAIAGCGVLAVILWISYLLSRAAAKKRKAAAKEERLRRREAKQKEYELAEKQQDELLKQVDAILDKKKKNANNADSPQWLEDSEQKEFSDLDYDDDDEDTDIDEELEKWLNSLPRIELGNEEDKKSSD